MPDFGIMRGFNEKLFGDKLVAGQLPTQLGLIGSSDFGFDVDAQAFFDRVTAAGGTLSATEKLAIDTLVRQMKLDGIWTAMKAIYPMVGASAAACAQNLKSSSFTGSFTSGWTFASTGVKGNGSSAYFDSNCKPLGFSSLHYSFYSRTTNTTGREIGIETGGFGYDMILSLGGTIYSRLGSSNIVTTNTDSKGFYLTTNLSRHKLFKNNTILGNNPPYSSAYPNLNIYIGATNVSGVASQFSSKECAFSSIGDGLTDTQASDLYTAVQAFQTTLSRQV